MNNKIFFFLLIQKPLFCAEKQEANPFEGYSIEDIALLFNYATVEENAIETTFHFPELKYRDNYYKYRNILKHIIFPGFHFLNQLILTPITNQWYEYRCSKNVHDNNLLWQINDEVGLYVSIDCDDRIITGELPYGSTPCYEIENSYLTCEYHRNKDQKLFLKNNDGTKYIPLQIHDVYMDSRRFVEFTNENQFEFKVQKTGYKKTELLSFIFHSLFLDMTENALTTFTCNTYKTTLPADPNIITELKNKELKKFFINNIQRILFLLSIIYTYTNKIISIKSLFCLPKLLHELYHQENWEEFFSQNSDVYNDEDFFWPEVIKMSFNIFYKPDVDKHRIQKNKKTDLDKLYHLKRAAQATNDPEIIKKYYQYKNEFEQKYEQ